MYRNVIVKPATIQSKVKQTLSPTLLVGMQISAATMDKSLEIPWKTKSRTITRLGIYTDKTIIQKNTRIPMFIATLYTTAKTWK